ncbi:MAG: hypothetical protein M3O55_04580 [Actinomycetota bacterium]|nr:hypothetical protein [Actinomycetota bacterium]
MRDDRLLPASKWSFGVILPVLATAFVLLYVWPGETHRLWAWTIKPDITPLAMGGGYLSGAWFFGRVLVKGEWHRAHVGVLATCVFTTLLGIATFLHWGKFNHDHVTFIGWLFLYVATPLLLPVLWVTNGEYDPRTPAPDDVVLGRGLRTVLVVLGAAQLAFALALFINPKAFISHWPWLLTPLTARTLASFAAFPASVWLLALIENRWSAFRYPMEAIAIGLSFTALGVLRARSALTGQASTQLLVVAALLGTIAFMAVLIVVFRPRPANARS